MTSSVLSSLLCPKSSSDRAPRLQYVLQAVNLMSRDTNSLSDPYLRVQLGTQVHYNSHNHHHNHYQHHYHHPICGISVAIILINMIIAIIIIEAGAAIGFLS